MDNITDKFPVLTKGASVTIDYKEGPQNSPIEKSVSATVKDVGSAMILIDEKPARIRVEDIIDARPQQSNFEIMTGPKKKLKNGLEHLVYNKTVSIKFTITGIKDVIHTRGLVGTATKTDILITSKDFAQPIKIPLKNIQNVQPIDD